MKQSIIQGNKSNGPTDAIANLLNNARKITSLSLKILQGNVLPLSIRLNQPTGNIVDRWIQNDFVRIRVQLFGSFRLRVLPLNQAN